MRTWSHGINEIEIASGECIVWLRLRGVNI